MGDDAVTYDATSITVLDLPDAVRKRPGMYIGSTGERGLHQLLFEVLEPAVDAVVAGRATSVAVTLAAGGAVRVAHDGDSGDPDTLLTRFLARPRPGGRSVVMSAFGVGPCVTNALSSRLTAEVRRDGVTRRREYVRGRAVCEPAVVVGATGNGTMFTFRPDPEIFGTTECSYAVLAERFRVLAFLNRTLDISLTDERGSGEPRSEHFRFPGGTRDFVASLTETEGEFLRAGIIAFEREDPRMAGTMEVALRWTGSGTPRILGYVNSRLTSEGTHIQGFLDGMAAAEADPGRGLTAVVSVKLDDPVFEGSTRGILGNDPVRACVAEATRARLSQVP
ncbi:DNA gyrase subunit B [Actinacidiphila alni]|uniref:DNA gyrase subunit B n=1 Tax=Actinacidiphila alni TaxID=380248 RepID=UPI0034570138